MTISFNVLFLIPILFASVLLVLIAFCAGAVYGKAEAVRTLRQRSADEVYERIRDHDFMAHARQQCTGEGSNE